MRKKLTIAAVILLILGALAAFAVLNLGRLVKSNKDYILAQAEQALGRKVAVEDIGVTVWGGVGIRLKNFALADDRAFSRKDALRAADLQVNVEFFPLLWKEVRVKRLILRQPVIRVIRNRKGKLNFASLGGPPPEKAHAKKAPPSGAPPGAAAALPLLVSRVKVADGEIHYLDKKDRVDLRVKKTELSVKNLGFDQPVSIELAAAVNADKQNLKFDGKVGPVPPTLDVSTIPAEGEVEIRSLNIDDLQRILPQITQYLPKGLGISGPLRARSKFSGSAQSLTLSGLELSATLFGAAKPNLQLTGSIGPLGKSLKDVSMKGDVKLGPVALAKLKRFGPLAGTLPKNLKVDGPLSMRTQVDGTLEKLAVTSTVEATTSTVRLGDYFRKPKGIPFVISTDARVTKKQITLQKADITLHTMKLTGKGTMTRGKKTALRLTLDSRRTDLAGWEKILPVLKGYRFSGDVEAHTRIKGQIKTGRIPDINGSLKMTGLRATLPQFPQPVTAQSATVTFTGRRATLPETPLRIGKSEVRLTAQVERFSPLAFTYRLSAPQVWLADVWKDTGSSKNPEVLRDVKDTGRVWARNGSLSYQGQIFSARGTIADIDYTQLQARTSLAKQVLTIESLKFRAYNGILTGTGTYDFRKTPPRFTLSSQFRDMDVSQLFRSASDTATKHIRGGANLDLKLAGSGNQWQDIQRNLTGQGQAEIVKGALTDVNIAESALMGLTGVPGLSVFISPNTRKKYPAIFGTKNTEFGQLKGSVNIRGGKVHLDNLLIAAPDWAATGKGWVTLDQQVGLKAQLVLSRQLSTDLIREVKLLKYLRDRQGRLIIPFTLAGTLPKATPQPDADYVARLVQRGLLEQGIQEGLKQLFK
ncbi:MAG: AsmA-like C-terminal region-containing protein [Candidatus Methylomirabilales bacterium]